MAKYGDFFIEEIVSIANYYPCVCMYSYLEWCIICNISSHRSQTSEEYYNKNFVSCSNSSLEEDALKAYNNYLKTTLLGKDSCLPPCHFSILRPKAYFKNEYGDSDEKLVVLRMPAIIKLTESTFSYPFMSFAAEFGGILLFQSICFIKRELKNSFIIKLCISFQTIKQFLLLKFFITKC